MFVGPDRYGQVMKRLVASAPELSVAVAFWGRGAEVHIHPKVSKPIRIICNLVSGGTNPWVVSEFLERAKRYPHVQVRQCDHLHAKVIIGGGAALIGSANISANGLGLEGGEVAKWLEAAVHTTGHSEVVDAQAWFDGLWRSNESRPISPGDLKKAIAAYKRNRDGRPDYSPKGPFTFDKFTPGELSDRNAFVLLYDSRPTKPAEAATAKFEQEEANLMDSVSLRGRGTDRWTFECWPETLDTSEGPEYLAIYWGRKTGRVIVDGSCRMISTQLLFEYPETGYEGWVDLARPAKTLLGHRLNPVDKRSLAKEIKPRIADIWNAAEPMGDGARRIQIGDLAALLQL